MKEIQLGKPELELAKKISHQVWEKYDDQFGYRTEKQTYNDNVSTGIPDNINFFWGQFDSHNQEEFFDKVLDSTEPGAEKLKLWCGQSINATRKAIFELKEMGIDL